MPIVNMLEAKSHLSRLAETVETGAEAGVIIAHGGPNDMPISAQEALGYFRDAGFEMLEIAPAHAVAIEALAPIHADPFDRMLVAQALTTPLRLLTHDSRIAAYSDTVIPA
jgi:hypothetical protein